MSGWVEQDLVNVGGLATNVSFAMVDDAGGLGPAFLIGQFDGSSCPPQPLRRPGPLLTPPSPPRFSIARPQSWASPLRASPWTP